MNPIEINGEMFTLRSIFLFELLGVEKLREVRGGILRILCLYSSGVSISPRGGGQITV
jgi:hypothetical protein